MDFLINSVKRENKDLRSNIRKLEDSYLDKKIILNIFGVVAYYDNNEELKLILNDHIDKDIVTSSTEIMALTNSYYKYLYYIKDLDINQKPANLKMTTFSNPPCEAHEFELYGLAISILSGCPSCIKSHFKALLEHYSKEQLQDLGRVLAIAQMLNQNLKN